jgi:uncharacterized protein YeeX (DUF496 family)
MDDEQPIEPQPINIFDFISGLTVDGVESAIDFTVRQITDLDHRLEIHRTNLTYLRQLRDMVKNMSPIDQGPLAVPCPKAVPIEPPRPQRLPAVPFDKIAEYAELRNVFTPREPECESELEVVNTFKIAIPRETPNRSYGRVAKKRGQVRVEVREYLLSQSCFRAVSEIAHAIDAQWQTVKNHIVNNADLYQRSNDGHYQLKEFSPPVVAVDDNPVSA